MVNSPGHTVAAILLLETKLYSPRWRPNLVMRPRLIELMHQGIERKLTLVSAPAGFGKTTLLAELLADSPDIERAAAWVSLDQSDNDPVFFWTYFVAALQKVQSNVGESALSLLHSPQPPPIEAVLTALINEINAIEDDLTLILDDYHVIDSQAVHNAMTFLLDHLPPQMHLVIASRSDPPLPLARFRGRGELTELRASDLRFTTGEAADFLNQVMGLDLSADDVATLETRTEGWIAGIQLAALSMRGREDASGFIRAFAGNDRYIVDYLVEEVLQRQTEQVRSFLLQTSILDRLSGPLCDSVTGQADSRGLLETLHRDNLFVVPLDDKRKWYRYHHLFADVLLARSMEEQPDKVPSLHRRASKWFERNGMLSDAVRHALAAEDFERAAALVELTWPVMGRSFQSSAILGWVKALPDDVVRDRPVLSVGYAWALLDDGEMEAAEVRLQDAERWLDAAEDTSERPNDPSIETVLADDEEFRSLPATIATARAYHAQSLGDVSATVTHARRALDLLPEEDHYWRGIAAALLGLAYWASGDLEAAQRSVADGVANLQVADNIHFQLIGTVMADIMVVQGRLHEAASTYEQSLQLAKEHGESVLRGTADLYTGLSELHRERGELEAASQYLLKGEELGEQIVFPGSEYRLRAAMARTKVSQGDLNGALNLLDEAERLYKRDPVPDARPVTALKARVWIVQGRLIEVLGWARGQGLSANDHLSYLREFEHITLARVLLAQYESDNADHYIHEARGLLDRLLNAAEEGRRTGSVIEILVLQALVHGAQGDISRALVPLKRALTLAEPEGYIQIFVDEGVPMERLLRRAALLGIALSFVTNLLEAFGTPSRAKMSVDQPLAEPLSEREIEILRLIVAGSSNRDISQEMVVALSTVKTHINNIYGKLDVRSRTQAVARARELGLV